MEKQVQIPKDEYKNRLINAQQLLSKTNLDGLLVNSNESEFANVRYFSNYWPIFEMAGVLIPRIGDPILIIGPESESYAISRSEIPTICKLIEYREPANPDYPGIKIPTFKDVFSEAGIPNPKNIGIAGYLVTTLPILDGLMRNFPNLTITNADEITVTLRSIKSPAELECLKRAFQISEIAIDEILNRIKPGLTELQVVGLAQKVIYENGAEYEGMPQYVFAGKRTNNAISRPTHTVLKKGDLIQLNISARVDGYSSGVGRPVCLGKMTPEVKKFVEFGKLAHEKTMEWMCAGVNASEVAKKYQQLFIDNGFEKNYLYGPCHGLGMIEVEPPWMEVTSDYELKQNMTFNVDTFIQEDEFGLRWENGVRITNDGVEMFSNNNMNIIEIE